MIYPGSKVQHCDIPAEELGRATEATHWVMCAP